MHALTGRSLRAVGVAISLVAGLGTVVTFLVLGPAPAAHADTTCQKVNPATGQCQISISVPGPKPTGSPVGSTGVNGPACYWNGTSQGIKNPPPGPVPCHTADGFWSNAYHCYISAAKPPPPAGDPSWQGHQPGDGAIYICYQPQTGIAIGIWSANQPAGPGQQLTPQQVAQLAIKKLTMHAIDVGLAPTPVQSNPNSMGVIGVPVWMWVDNPSSTTYGPLTASASAGGITVTAKASVERVKWDMGDGSALINCGAGTPYNSSVHRAKPSPDCGYTYSKTSWDKPNHEYTVTARSYWRVDWSGAGQSGTIQLPALVSTVRIKEGELQVLNKQG